MEMRDLVVNFQKKCPELVRQMMNSDHNFSLEEGILSPYHSEGTIFCHTMMVCLLAEQFKSPDLVKLASLLHDIGKPMAQEVFFEERKTKFIGHEGLSVALTLDCLIKMGIKLRDKDLSLLMSLISHHTMLYRIMESEKYESKILEKFQRNKELYKLLIELSRVDALGRFAENKDKFLLLEPKLISLIDKIEDNVPTKITENTITLLIGPPLSGKSTWLKSNRLNEVVICRDDIVFQMGGSGSYSERWNSIDQKEVDKEFNRLVTEALRSKKDVIIDKTNCSIKSRRSILSQAPKDYKKKAVVFYTPYDELLKRNRQRFEKEGKYVNEGAIKQIIKSYFSPLYYEFDEIVDVFNY